MKYCALLFLVGLVASGCRSGSDSDKKVIVNVSVQRAAAKDVPLVVSAPATVFGKSEAHISARITASVRQVLVHKGEPVKAGQASPSLIGAILKLNMQTPSRGCKAPNRPWSARKARPFLSS